MADSVSKNAINRLNVAPIKVTMFNGCFNVAVAVAEFSRYKYELRVEVPHPLLEWQCGNKQAVELIIWRGSNGSFVQLPADILLLVERMKKAATMSDVEAALLSQSNQASYKHAMLELGVTQAMIPFEATV